MGFQKYDKRRNNSPQIVANNGGSPYVFSHKSAWRACFDLISNPRGETKSVKSTAEEIKREMRERKMLLPVNNLLLFMAPGASKSTKKAHLGTLLALEPPLGWFFALKWLVGKLWGRLGPGDQKQGPFWAPCGPPTLHAARVGRAHQLFHFIPWSDSLPLRREELPTRCLARLKSPARTHTHSQILSFVLSSSSRSVGGDGEKSIKKRCGPRIFHFLGADLQIWFCAF